MANNDTNYATKDIVVSGHEIETVSKFKYLGAIVTDEGSRPEILACIAKATAVVAKLKSIWKDKNIKLCTKVRQLVIASDFHLPIRP